MENTMAEKAENESPGSQPTAHEMEASWKPQGHGHMMAHDDVENPQNFPLHLKMYASLVASAFTFTLLFAATSYSAALPLIVKAFGVTQVKAVLGQSVFIFGIIPAPLVTPHLSEKFGRYPVYMASLLAMSLFIVGASQSQTFGALVACRFCAGLTGGPIAVLIEGTYADVWPAAFTGSYYTFITSSQYFGAATGAILGGILSFSTSDWRWTQYITLMIAAGSFLLGLAMPETYPRQITRRRERKAGVPSTLEPALSGTTIGEMARLTLVQPFMMLFTDPLTALIALFMAMNFGITFQWFISVPATLTMLAKFDGRQDGLAFISAIGGTVLAAISTLIIDQIGARRNIGKTVGPHLPAVEHRLISCIMGSILLATAVFWVANTAAPQFSFYIPIVGTAVFVWGSAMCLTGFIGYLFDVYSPQAILSSLSVVAYARLVTAGWLPLVIIPLTNDLTPKWGLNLLGFFAAAFIFIPVGLYFCGTKLRLHSRYHHDGEGMSPTMMVDEKMDGEAKA